MLFLQPPQREGYFHNLRLNDTHLQGAEECTREGTTQIEEAGSFREDIEAAVAALSEEIIKREQQP